MIHPVPSLFIQQPLSKQYLLQYLSQKIFLKQNINQILSVKILEILCDVKENQAKNQSNQ